MGGSASIYFFAGDFADVLRRHTEGLEQTYATHDECAKLFKGLLDAGVELTIHSFVTPEAREERPLDGLRIVSLGARGYADSGLLHEAVAKDRSDAIVAHFPNMELLRAVIATNCRSMAVLANSYNRRGPKAWLERWRVAKLLNNPKFELVSNHCLPATNHLASFGVDRSKLIAWDVPHRFEPKVVAPKTLAPGRVFKVAFAGAIRADKGVADLIHAAAQLKSEGLELKCSFAGSGEIEEMQALGRDLGVSDLLDFRGLVPNGDVFGLFRNADVVVVPSHKEYTEGFPLTMFEAIGSRTPIICSDHPMFVPVLKNGVHAALFSGGDAGAFADALRRVLTDADLYARLSANADLTWAALKGPADWRTMLSEWILRGRNSDWIDRHMLVRSSRPVPEPANSSVRLAYLTSQYPAASHTFIRREVEALRELGWAIDTFSVRPPGGGEAASEADRSEADRTFYILKQSARAFLAAHLAELFSRPGRYLRTFGLALSHRAHGGRGLLLGIAHFAESVLLARELRKRGTTHLHNHFANSAATVGLLASRHLGIRWSFTMHGISETDYPAGLMLGRKIEAADLVVCVSWFGRAQGMRLVHPSEWEKMRVVRCGLPFDRIPLKSPAASGNKTIICVGRLSPEKGQAGLLRAFAKVRSSHAELTLRLVGDGPERGALEAVAEELGVSGAVTFAGCLPEEETLAEIACSDLLVLPSFMEGLPIVLMEAMAVGVPVIASRVAGIPELVEDGATGLLFTPSNWDELASGIDRLLGDETLQTRLAERAKAKVAAEFDTRKSAGELARLFSSASGDRK